MRDALLAWFDESARRLPWREPSNRSDPYRVLVAEVMLQQTQVATVVPYYGRWLDRFPDLRSLADADDAAVLRAWQGLGYYRRARNLQRAAREAVARFGGTLPPDRSALASLPGIGPYTSAAVAALAFGRREIAVDGNVRRLACRLHAWDTPPSDLAVERALQERLGDPTEGRAHPGDAGRLAEALIELGALVCTAATPACGRCPLAAGCAAHGRRVPESIPRARPRRAPPLRRRFALVAIDDRQVWLCRRQDDELLGGLWGFPQVGEAPVQGRCLDTVRHAYSHFRLELVPVLVPADHPQLIHATGAAPHPFASLRELPLSKVDLRVLARLAAAGLVPRAAVS